MPLLNGQRRTSPTPTATAARLRGRRRRARSRCADDDRGGDPRGGARDRRRRVPRAGAERRRLLRAARRATSSGCARSATATACCSCRDEVICAFGRLGRWFGAERYGYQPDMITFAKGVTSGYSPLGGVMVSDRIAEPFLEPGRVVPPRHHLRRPPGELRGGAGQPRRDRARGPARPRAEPTRTSSASALETLADLPIVGEVRGDGLLLRHRAGEGPGRPARRSSDDECEWLLRGFLVAAAVRARA